jgi:hypothetical protein
VAENIRYAIPGGGTARKTYDLGAGECGAHAMLLAAFCRRGHPGTWSEVHVCPSYGSVFRATAGIDLHGSAGWSPWMRPRGDRFRRFRAPHIGVYESPVTALNPRQMQVLAYRAGAQQMVEPRTRPQTSTGPAPANPPTLPTGTW